MSMLFYEAEIAYRQEQVREGMRRVGRTRRRRRHGPPTTSAPDRRQPAPATGRPALRAPS
jgi:hypothetical protein